MFDLLGVFGLSGFFVLTIAFVSYIVLSDYYHDFYFFIRNKQFKKKVLNENFSKIWDFLPTLMHTYESDWKKENSSISYEVFPNTFIHYTITDNGFCHEWNTLMVFEGKGQKIVFEMTYYNDEEGIQIQHDGFSKEKPNENIKNYMKQLKIHLDNIYTIKFGSYEEKEEKIELIVALDNDFHYQMTIINQLLSNLEKNSKWLDVETLYRIKETIPNDIKELVDVYESVEEKDSVQKDIELSLEIIIEKLQSFAKVVEDKKHKEIKKRRSIIENR